MTTHLGSTSIKDMYYGSIKIKEAYLGNTKVWQYVTYTFTIAPTPSDATVTLSATGYSQVGKSITVKPGTTVSWSVSKSGYVTQSGSQVVNANETKNVTLQASSYPAGTVIYESSKSGTYSITLAYKQNYEIWMVGGGAGGSTVTSDRGGGSGAYIHGTIQIQKGTYSVSVGAGGAGKVLVADAGGPTTFLNQTAGGGHIYDDGAATYTITLSGLTGTKGKEGTKSAAGASVYGGYGKGGFGSKQAGGSGYFKIVAR